MARKIVALITDFGLDDAYVGSLKGAILSGADGVSVVDITHNVRPFDLVDAAFKLKSAYRYFPGGTVFLVGVDPDPGAESVIVSTENYYIVCPNNGVVSLMVEEEAFTGIYLITAEHYFLKSYGNFRTRDVLAPIAARLADLGFPEYLGEKREFEFLRRFKIPEPVMVASGVFECIVLDVDRFGNLVLNMRYDGKVPSRVVVGKHEITMFSDMFRKFNLEKGQMFISVNPEGYFQIVSYMDSAAYRLGVNRGYKVNVEFGNVG